MRIGQGLDVHAFGPGREIILGGVHIPHAQGIRAHSDGDVLLHALCDALLGAAALGDIGRHFPDSDPQYKDIDSRQLLRMVMEKVRTQESFATAVTGLAADAVRELEVSAALVFGHMVSVAIEANRRLGRVADTEIVGNALAALAGEGGKSLRMLVLLAPGDVFVLLNIGCSPGRSRAVAGGARAGGDTEMLIRRILGQGRRRTRPGEAKPSAQHHQDTRADPSPDPCSHVNPPDIRNASPAD